MQTITSLLVSAVSVALMSCSVAGQTQFKSPSIQVNGKTIKFKSMEHGKLHFEGGVEREFHDVEVEIQKEIMEYTGWGRTWEADDGKHVIADLVGVEDQIVILETIDGKHHSVDIERLSKTDRDYAEARHGTTEESLPGGFKAKVIEVFDGDTVTVLLNKRHYRIRIAGIDAPELDQAFGNESKRYLSNLVLNKMVYGVCKGSDKYARNICTFQVTGGEIVQNAMVKSGMAWHYTKHSSDETLARLEQEAKKAKLGLWANPNPESPWDWRTWGSDDRKKWANKQLESEVSPRLVAAKAEKQRRANELSLAKNRRRAEELELVELQRRAAELSEDLAEELAAATIRRRSVESWESWVRRLEYALSAKRRRAELKRGAETYSYHRSSRSRTIHTGPRGGRYYYNSNGNKTYVK